MLPKMMLVVGITLLYMQCAKAVMRSRLWDGRGRPNGLPTLGELIKSHSSGAFGGAALDDDMPAIYQRTMY